MEEKYYSRKVNPLQGHLQIWNDKDLLIDLKLKRATVIPAEAIALKL